MAGVQRRQRRQWSLGGGAWIESSEEVRDAEVGGLKTSFRKRGSCLRGPSALGEMGTDTQPSCLPHRALGAFEALRTMFGIAGKQPCRIHEVLPFSNRSINSPQSRLWLRRLVFKTTAPSQPP